jgi:hypothetical protein
MTPDGPKIFWLRITPCFTKGKFCIIAERPANKGLGMLQMSSAKMEAIKYGYVRTSTDDQTTALTSSIGQSYF